MNHKRESYPSDLRDPEWEFVALYLTLMREDAPNGIIPCGRFSTPCGMSFERWAVELSTARVLVPLHRFPTGPSLAQGRSLRGDGPRPACDRTSGPGADGTSGMRLEGVKLPEAGLCVVAATLGSSGRLRGSPGSGDWRGTTSGWPRRSRDGIGLPSSVSPSNESSSKCITDSRQANGWKPPLIGGKALVHIHCHHKAVIGTSDEMELLKKMGIEVSELEKGCCGLAGSFGFEPSHYDVSKAIPDQRLLPAVRAATNDELLIANGFSCQTQIVQGAG